nr:wax ester/triacylglycerol synthase family O-acyltransferase [Petropleomorpha daqingensis]
MTAEDRLVLWPDRVWPQDIGALLVLDGADLLDGSGAVRIDDLRRVIAGRLHLVPRFRQLLVTPRRGLGRPLWVDDPRFDIDAHVRVAPLPAHPDESELLECVAALRRRRLDRARPLWEMWVLPGLPDRRVGLFVRLHHVVADGIAGVATMGALLDAPGARETIPPWTPAPAPSARELLIDDLRSRIRRAGSALGHPRAALGTLGTVRGELQELLADDGARTTTLNRVVGAERRLALARADMPEVTALAAAHGATVDDVLLTVTAGGLRALLAARGELSDDLVVRVFVPVTLRPRGSRARARGNLIGQMVVPLPVGTADPVARLEAIAAETTRRKARRRPSLATLFHGRLVSLVLLKLMARRPVNVETADVPGPTEPVFLAGARVLEVFPLLNLVGTVPVGIGALSYAGRLGIMLTVDREAVADLDVLAGGLRRDLAALLGPAAQTPWEAHRESGRIAESHL